MDEPVRVRFVGSEYPCASTGHFRFERAAGQGFRAGQYLRLGLSTRDGWLTKPFSHCDAPGDPHTEILTRLTHSAFKDALVGLKPGDEVEVSGPFGDLTMPEGPARAAFLVGGVGVTPMRSMLRDVIARGSGLEMLCFVGNPDESCIPFREEYDAIEREHRGIRFVHVLERPSERWSGETGFITADVVRSHCDPLDGWHWYVCGPPMMVEAMRRVLTELSVSPSSASFELFAGY